MWLLFQYLRYELTPQLGAGIEISKRMSRTRTRPNVPTMVLLKPPLNLLTGGSADGTPEADITSGTVGRVLRPGGYSIAVAPRPVTEV